MHESEWYVCKEQVSLDDLVERGWDIADKREVGARDNLLVPDEDDKE